MTARKSWMVGAAVLLAGAGAGRAAEEAGPLAPLQPNQALTVNALLGTVNGEPVFVQDVLRPLDADLRRLARVSRNLSEFRALGREAISRQINIHINDALILRAAKDALGDEDSKRVDMYMNKVRHDLLTQYGGSEARTEQQLRAQGSSIDRELAEKKRRAIIDLYLHKVLWPKITVTRQQVLNEYQRDLAKFTVPAEVDLYTITLPVSRFLKEPDPENPGKQRTIAKATADQIAQATNLTLARARELIEQIRKGADFAELAEANSIDPKSKDGGRWPHTKKGDLAKQEVEKTAFGLPANGIGEPVLIIETDPVNSVVVIVKVGEASVARVIPFAEAQKEIDKKLREVQYVQLTHEYYRKLQEKAAIEALDRMADTATEAAVSRYAVQ